MFKKFLLFLVALLIVAGGVGAGALYFSKKSTSAVNDADWWKDENKVFTVTLPADYDAFRTERLEEKKVEALELYRANINDTWTWLVIANYYEYAQAYEQAEKSYQRVLSLQENESMALANLATLYEYRLNDLPKAEAYHKRYLEMNTNNPISYMNLGSFYANKMNQPEEAEKIYLSGLEATNNDPDLLVHTINFFKRINKMEEAKKYAQILLKNFPDNPLYQRDYGDLVK